MKPIYPILSLLFMLLTAHAGAQSDGSILRVGLGANQTDKLFSGYFFSADAAFPINRFLMAGPTVTASYEGSGTFASFSQSGDGRSSSFGYPIDGPKRDAEYRQLSAALGALIWINPLELNRARESRHEFWVGAGYAYRVLFRNWIFYDLDGADVDLRSAYSKSYGSLSPIYLRLLYQYALSERTALGLQIGFDDVDGEAELSTSVQFGVRF